MAYRRAEDVWRVRFIIPADAVEAFENALDPLTDSFVCFEIEDGGPNHLCWQIDAYAAQEIPRQDLIASIALAAQQAGIPEPAVELEHHPAQDWLGDNLQAFPPIQAGRFFIHGSHWTDLPAGGSTPLLFDAATAFGTGEHQSTFGCLVALSNMANTLHPLKIGLGRVLDMGCGSGILGIAAAKQFKTPALLVDIDEESVRVARGNARGNGVAGLVHALPGDGFRLRAVAETGPYDLIFANILARPLCSMAYHLAANLAPGGRAVLAGLLDWQEPMVLAAYRARGLRLMKRYSFTPWVTLVIG